MQTVILNVQVTYQVDVKSQLIAMRKAYYDLLEHLPIEGDKNEGVICTELRMAQVLPITEVKNERA